MSIPMCAAICTGISLPFSLNYFPLYLFFFLPFKYFCFFFSPVHGEPMIQFLFISLKMTHNFCNFFLCSLSFLISLNPSALFWGLLCLSSALLPSCFGKSFWGGQRAGFVVPQLFPITSAVDLSLLKMMKGNQMFLQATIT